MGFLDILDMMLSSREFSSRQSEDDSDSVFTRSSSSHRRRRRRQADPPLRSQKDERRPRSPPIREGRGWSFNGSAETRRPSPGRGQRVEQWLESDVNNFHGNHRASRRYGSPNRQQYIFNSTRPDPALEAEGREHRHQTRPTSNERNDRRSYNIPLNTDSKFADEGGDSLLALRRLLAGLTKDNNHRMASNSRLPHSHGQPIMLQIGELGLQFQDLVEQENGSRDSAQRLDLYRQLINQWYVRWALTAAPPSRECVVCGDRKELTEFPNRISRACSHEVGSCRRCLSTWIASQLQDRGWDKIACPECSKPLGHKDVHAHAEKGVFDRYDRLRTRARLSALPDFRWCTNPSCDGGQVHSFRQHGAKFRCDMCGHRHCIKHNTRWHSSETCEEYDKRKRKEMEEKKKMDERSEKWKSKETRQCPRCASPIEKNGGCDHMTCSRCYVSFGWSDAKPYSAPPTDSRSSSFDWMNSRF